VYAPFPEQLLHFLLPAALAWRIWILIFAVVQERTGRRNILFSAAENLIGRLAIHYSGKENLPMEFTMTFTIFTATYNRRHTLGRLSESLGAQTFRDFEWVVVDDGSRDGTMDFLRELQARASFPLRFIYQPNSGKQKASNRAIDLAAGELFATLDSDDTLEPQALERLYFHWCSIPIERRQEFSGVNCLCVKADGTVLGDRYPMNPGQETLDSDALTMMALKLSGDKWGFHRTDIMRAHPFPIFEGERFIPDGLLWNRIGSKYRLRYVNEPLRRVYFEEIDCQSRRNVEFRIRNPRGSQLFYQEQIRFAPTAPLRFKAIVNYIRFSLHGRLSMDIKPGTLALFPAGLALWLHDRRVQRRAA
jgi:glycosyltransferase involved in cell wall biosynthesis